MSPKFRLYKPFIIPVALTIVAFVSLFLFLPKEVASLSKNLRLIKVSKEEISQLKNKYLLVSSLDSKILEDQTILAKLALPDDKDISLILQALKESAESASFLVKSLKFAPGEMVKEDIDSQKTTKKRIEELPIELKLVGQFSNLENLFAAFERSFPVFQIDELKVVSFQRGEGNVTVEVKVITFYSPPTVFSDTSKIELENLILNEEEIEFLKRLSTFRKVNVGSQLPSDVSPRENPFIF